MPSVDDVSPSSDAGPDSRPGPASRAEAANDAEAAGQARAVGKIDLGRRVRHLLDKRTAAVAAAVVVSVGGVGGIAYALTSGSAGGSPPGVSTSTVPPSYAAQGGSATSGGSSSGAGSAAQGAAPAKRRVAARLLKLLAGSVHDEFVIPTATGGFRTVELDKGTITSISSTSVTIAPLSGASDVTATITSSTREPKKATLSQGETVDLVYSNGDALLVRPAKARPAGSGSTGSGTSGSGSGGSTTSVGSLGQATSNYSYSAIA